MTNTYFDIETSGFDAKVDKLLTVQFQQIDSKGFPVGDLNILKENKGTLMYLRNMIDEKLNKIFSEEGEGKK